MKQTEIVREALSKGIETIEGIIKYGMDEHGVLVREHSINNVLRQQAVDEEIDRLRSENEKLRKALEDAQAKLSKRG